MPSTSSSIVIEHLAGTTELSFYSIGTLGMVSHRLLKKTDRNIEQELAKKERSHSSKVREQSLVLQNSDRAPASTMRVQLVLYLKGLRQ
ncbi:MAG: hypothetical protein KME40_04555 [Komarekiella atlantica HA4396-MV6]|jgi:hypothetical protein|nr:hypothetical protein [Komarekiella atlantica HA4396-MV6]